MLGSAQHTTAPQQQLQQGNGWDLHACGPHYGPVQAGAAVNRGLGQDQGACCPVSS
jgi:hypothetical protein